MFKKTKTLNNLSKNKVNIIKSNTFGQKMTKVDENLLPKFFPSTKEVLELIGPHGKINIFLYYLFAFLQDSSNLKLISYKKNP